jgi:serine/threonine protein kinase
VNNPAPRDAPVKLTDFGLARAADDASLTQSGIIAGTPLYMAPEQAAGEPIDARADLFSLGRVRYAMCTGRPAFSVEAHRRGGKLCGRRGPRAERAARARARGPSGPSGPRRAGAGRG